MKKIIITLTAILMLSGVAQAVSKDDQAKLSGVLSSIGLKSMWSQDISLWIKGSGYTKYELEGIGHQICASTGGKGLGFYVVTFWHQFGQGKITSVGCSS
jgi:hypothetical protein